MKESDQVAKPSTQQPLQPPSHASVYRQFLMARERKTALRALHVLGRVHRILNLSHAASGSLNLLRYISNAEVFDATLRTLDGERILGLPGFKQDAERLHVMDNQIGLATNAVDCVFCQNLLPELLTSEERLELLREFSRVTSKWLVVSHTVSNRRRASHALGTLLPGRTARRAIADDLMSFELAKGGFDVVAKIRVGPVISDYCFYVSKLRKPL
ncbi:hypothetical protein [Pseudomonas huaxiensis]|uniref:hypothetical protein n=1 Tax=Pseudomonas huaxiensis TaxID=2213017 RepID=UPI000DA65D2E|nr:hypothetical protein [Pseudomonas huaxiensis]